MNTFTKLPTEKRLADYKISAADAQKDFNCPALPICEMLGNVRDGCAADGPLTMDLNVCLASLIILVARGQGITIDPVEQSITEYKKRPIGFTSDSGSNE